MAPPKAKNPDQYIRGITNHTGPGRGDGPEDKTLAHRDTTPTEIIPQNIPISLVRDHKWTHIITHARGGPHAKIGEGGLGRG